MKNTNDYPEQQKNSPNAKVTIPLNTTAGKPPYGSGEELDDPNVRAALQEQAADPEAALDAAVQKMKDGATAGLNVGIQR